MLTRPKLSINPTLTINRISQIRYKSSQGSCKSGFKAIPRKFSPQVNKSFTCYKETFSSTPKARSFSVSKHINGLESPKNRQKSSKIRNRDLRSTTRLTNGHPGPGDLEETTELKYKKEVIASWLERGLSEQKLGEYSSAINFLTKVLKEDPNHTEALLQRAYCMMNTNEYRQAIPDLLAISQDNPFYDKKIYLALAMCFAGVNDLDTAIRQLNRGLLKYPRYTEAYVARGQLYAEQMKWEKALQDFHKAISLNSSDGSAHIGLGDAYAGMKDNKNAFKAYTQATQSTSCSFIGLKRRAKLLFDLQDYSNSLSDIELALSYNAEDSELYYYKALIMLSKENLTEAALCLEQTIKFDGPDKKYTGPAIYDLGAIKIKIKDYYGAIYTFKRATDSNLEVKEQKILKAYVEAILFLMKRKFKEGISLLSHIIKKKHPLIQEYVGNCYSFRGYGYACIEKHDQAVRNFILASKLQDLDNASKFNLKVSNAILLSEKKSNEALLLLEEASSEFPKNIEPLAYQASIYLSQSRATGNKKLAEKAKSLLDKAINMRDNDSDLYYFRGMVHYYLNKPIEAVPDYEIAIDKAEDNIPIHFISRGLCYAQLKLYREAIQDFSIAIQLNETLSEAYFYRGRCAYLIDDSTQAFQDFQKMIINKNNDPLVHVHAGDLLMLVGSTEDASKAYTNANSIRPTYEAFIQKSKCNMLTNRPDLALLDLESALSVKSSKEIEFDIEILKILSIPIDANDYISTIIKQISLLSKAMQLGTEGLLFKSKHLHWYKGSFLFIISDYQKAKIEFKAALDTKNELEDPYIEKDNIEVLYNLALCYIFNNQLEAALIHLNELVHVLEGINRGQVLLLVGILNLALQRTEEAKSLMLEAFKYDSTTTTSYLEEHPSTFILPFSSKSFLATNYPKKELKVSDCYPVNVRPSFSLPYIPLPSMDFFIETHILDNFLIKSIKCKPEAPWLNRVKGTIQFTEEIREICSESVETTNKTDSDTDSSVFNASFSDAKVFRSAAILTDQDQVKQNTVNLFEFVKKKTGK